MLELGYDDEGLIDGSIIKVCIIIGTATVVVLLVSYSYSVNPSFEVAFIYWLALRSLLV